MEWAGLFIVVLVGCSAVDGCVGRRGLWVSI